MLILALAALAAAPQTAHSPATPAESAASPTGMHWGDYDADGFADAVALLPGGEARLLRNLGDGTLEDVTSLVGLPAGMSAKLALWGDYDADGELDLYLGSLDGESRLWRQTAGTFQDVTERLGLEPAVAPLAARWIDYDGDGTADLHLSTAGGELLYHGLGGTAFERVDLGLLAPAASTNGGAVGSARVAAANTQPGVPAANGSSPDGTDADSAGRPSSSGGRTDLAVSGVTRAPNGTAALGTGVCVDGLLDQAGGACINASSTPTLGSLYPISSDLYVGPATGFVGINELIPDERLHVRGNLKVESSAFADGSLGSGAITVYASPTLGLNIDGNEIESVGSPLYLNFFNDLPTRINDDTLTISGGNVGVNTPTPSELFHVNAGLDDFVVQSDGDVGVGTLTPDVRFQVVGGTDATLTGGGFALFGEPIGANLVLDDNEIMARSVGAPARLNLNLEGGDVRIGENLELVGDASKIEFLETASPTASLFYDGAGLTGPANRVHLRSELTGELRNVMTWELGGDVGIGTNTPETRLQISGGSDVSPGGGGYIQLGSQSGQNIAIDNNEIMARSNGAVARLSLNADGGDVAFLANASAGDVGIGTNSPQKKLDVAGDIRCVGLTQTSDARFKRNVHELEDALAAVLALRGVSFEWDKDVFPQGSEGRNLGFLAQEVRSVLPDAVTETDDGYLSVSYSAVVPVLVEAVRELSDEKDAEIAELRASNAELTARVERLEAVEADLASLRASLEALVDGR